MKTDSLERGSIPDIIALAVLVIITWLAAGFFLRDDIFIYGDHPGRYWLMWYTLNVAWPLHHRLVDWIPYWYAGYPELQFYPPGFVLVGWLLNLITVGRFSTAIIYEIVAFASYALPGFTFYYAIRHLGFDSRTAFTAGLFGLIFPAVIGGAAASFIGLIGSRLAFGLNALVSVWTIDVIGGRGARSICLAAFALAAGILAHPYHEIGIVLLLGLYVLVRRLSLIHTGARLLAIVLLAAALDAFWLVPLFEHSSAALVPVIRSTLDQTWRQVTDPALLPYALLALPALVHARHEKDASRRALLRVLLALPFILAATMLTIHWVLIERLHFYQLDPARMIGEFYLPVILLAAIGVSEIATWVAHSVLFKHMSNAIPTWTVTGFVGMLMLIPFLQSSAYFWPKATAEPRFLSQAIIDYRFNDLWEELSVTPGRVWFTSYYSHLSAHGADPLPTTLPALTPLFARRQMMGGTFTEWSPIAALLWVGKINPPVLWGLSEEQDDRALFGVLLEELSDAQLVEYCRRLNITAIVASLGDFKTRTFLDASPHFKSYYNNGFFFVYRLTDVAPTWLEARNATVDLTTMADDRIDLRVRAAQSDANVGMKVYAYPLWHATTDNGQPLAITRDSLGLMQIALPQGENYSVTVRYDDGTAEQLGKLVSGLCLISLGGYVAFAISKRVQIKLPNGS